MVYYVIRCWYFYQYILSLNMFAWILKSIISWYEQSCSLGVTSLILLLPWVFFCFVPRVSLLRPRNTPTPETEWSQKGAPLKDFCSWSTQEGPFALSPKWQWTFSTLVYHYTNFLGLRLQIYFVSTDKKDLCYPKFHENDTRV